MAPRAPGSLNPGAQLSPLEDQGRRRLALSRLEHKSPRGPPQVATGPEWRPASLLRASFTARLPPVTMSTAFSQKFYRRSASFVSAHFRAGLGALALAVLSTWPLLGRVKDHVLLAVYHWDAYTNAMIMAA